jgi:thiol-disulfide isomerase/thioredoxin
VIVSRILFLGALFASALILSLPAAAAEWKPFTAKALADAQEAGKSILVDISAPWCPVCRAQRPILEELTSKPEFKNLVVLEMDFDTQKPDLRALKATSQSTLIAFKGKIEMVRSAGDTNPGTIEALLQSTL